MDEASYSAESNPRPSEEFGRPVAISGDTIVAGVPLETHSTVIFDDPIDTAAMFSVAVPPVMPLTPTSSTTFLVRFAPTDTGTRTATLHIASNDEDETPSPSN